MSAANPMKLSDKGTPFPNKETAEQYRKDKELDDKIWRAYKNQGGWVLFDTSVVPKGMLDQLDAAAEAESNGAASNLPPKMKYHRVIFQAKTSPNDEEDVTLTLNGDVMICKRETEVILPESYLEIADHAVHNQYEQKPGQPRKKVGKVKKYVYTRLKAASEEEFLASLAKGNKERDEFFDKQAKAQA